VSHLIETKFTCSDAGGHAASKYGRSTATARKDFSGSGRPAAEYAANPSRRQQPVAQQPRNRYVDKRPRNRGPYSVDQKEEVGLDFGITAFLKYIVA